MHDYSYHDSLAHLGIAGAHPGGLLYTKKLLKDFNLNQKHHVLDAGCGTGQTAAYIASKYGCSVTAVDNHPKMFEKAQKRFVVEKQPITLLLADIEQLPFEDSKFDFIITESVAVFTRIRKTLSEFHRVLKKNGQLLTLEMTASPRFPVHAQDDFKQLYNIDKIPTELDWLNYFREADFKNVTVIDSQFVADKINENSPTDDMEDTYEFDTSEDIDPSLLQFLVEHQQLTEMYQNDLKFTVFHSIK